MEEETDSPHLFKMIQIFTRQHGITSHNQHNFHIQCCKNLKSQACAHLSISFNCSTAVVGTALLNNLRTVIYLNNGNKPDGHTNNKNAESNLCNTNTIKR
jgi:hypothetical protein